MPHARAPPCYPQPVFDVPAVLRRIAAETHHRAARARRRSTSRSLRSPTDGGDLVELAAGGDRRGRGPGRAGPAHARRARLRDRAHRLRAHRVDGHASPCAGTTTIPRPSHAPRAAPSPASRCASSTTRWRCRRASRARSSCGATTSCSGYFDDPEADAPRRSTPTAGCTPATSASMDDARLPAHHRPQQGHVHRRRLQRLSGRDRERCCSRHPTIAQVAVVGVPDERLGEVGVAFVVLRPGAPVDADEIVDWAASRWPTTRCRGASRSSTSCRSTRPARC